MTWRAVSLALLLLALAACGGGSQRQAGGVDPATPDSGCDGSCANTATNLTVAEVETVIAQAVADREAAAGTGVGHGIAIPHARLEGLDRSFVVTGVCRDGVEWDEIDDKPAHLIFLVLTPTEDEEDTQLEILAKIARAFYDDDRAHRLVHATDGDAAWSALSDAMRAAV